MRGGGQAPSVELFRSSSKVSTTSIGASILAQATAISSTLRPKWRRCCASSYSVIVLSMPSVQDVAQLSCDVALSGGRLHAAAEQALVHLPKRRVAYVRRLEQHGHLAECVSAQ